MATTGELHNLEWYSGVPRSIRNYVLFGVALIAVTFLGFGTWAATAPLSAAVIAPGSFVATGENKIVQHFEGGIVKELLVREGDEVTVGEALLLLDPTAANASAQQLHLRLLRLEMIWARLNAVANHASEIVVPASVTASLDNLEVAAMAASQQSNFEAAQNKLENEAALMQQNVAALEFRIAGRRGQVESLQTQLELLMEDQAVVRDLTTKGISTQSNLRVIERSVNDAQGSIARLESEIQEADAQAEKYRREIIQASDVVSQTALNELQAVEAELDAVREQIQQANSVLSRTTIVAPVNGTVVRMFYHTTGGVIESGKPIFEILPANVPLIVEVKIPRMQIDEVRQGISATVRLTALNQRTTPVLQGEVIYLSADTIADATDMNHEVYIARVSIPQEQLDRVPGFHPTPGMPAEVFVQTRERTFLEYLVKPVTDSMSRAFHER